MKKDAENEKRPGFLDKVRAKKGKQNELSTSAVRGIIHEYGVRAGNDAVKFTVEQSKHNHDRFKWEWIVGRAAGNTRNSGIRETVHKEDIICAREDYARKADDPYLKLGPRGEQRPNINPTHDELRKADESFWRRVQRDGNKRARHEQEA